VTFLTWTSKELYKKTAFRKRDTIVSHQQPPQDLCELYTIVPKVCIAFITGQPCLWIRNGSPK